MESVWRVAPVSFFFNDTATTEIYTLSLHDALPISFSPRVPSRALRTKNRSYIWPKCATVPRSEEHTSELQSHLNLVCRLLLEKKNPAVKGDDLHNCYAGQTVVQRCHMLHPGYRDPA